MSNKIIINLEPTSANDAINTIRNIPLEVTNRSNIITSIITIILLGVFTLVSVAQVIQWKPLDTFIAFQDIQRNFNRWRKTIEDYEVTESNRIKSLIPSMSNFNQFTCVDYGTFYIPITFMNNYRGAERQHNDGKLLLPTAVRRGNGDGWAVTKSASVDPSALQQCLYVASERSDSLITCGSDMYNKLGYGGYFNQGHWCNVARDKLYNVYKN